MRGLIVLLMFALAFSANGQTPSGLCDPNTPFIVVNMTGNPNGTYVSPTVQRDGLCCTNENPDRCLEFQITLDPGAIAIQFDIASGAVPPGALFYQINCGPLTPVGQPICLNGPGPHTLTFCKPGNNNNTYSIQSIVAPKVSPDRITRSGCSTTIGTQGIQLSSITWREITSGNNQYSSYLSCTANCDTTTVTPTGTPPAFVDYVICGIPKAGSCYPVAFFCDTIRVNFKPNLLDSINPNPAIYCANQSGIQLNGFGYGGFPPYAYVWRNSANAVVSNSSTYFATAGTYTLEVRDSLYPGCPGYIGTSTVVSQPVPTVNAGTDKTYCATAGLIQLQGTVTNASGAQWLGGQGTFTPNNSALNATYLASASEIAAGFFHLILTSTGNGVCSPAVDTIFFTVSSKLNVDLLGNSLICPGTTTSISSNVSGGLAAYNYSWNTGVSTPGLSNVGAGTYILTVRDNSNFPCIARDTLIIVANPPITVNIAADTLFACSPTSFVTGTAVGSSKVVSYVWSNGDGGTSVQLSPGKYFVTASDSLGCQVKDSVVVAQPSALLSATIQEPAPVCFGTQGTLSAQGVAGYGGYTYQWATGETTKSISKPTGTYCVTVTDAKGCVASKCGSVQQLPQLSVVLNGSQVLCKGATTTITAVVSGGKSPYTYSWSTGSTTNSITNVGPGSYYVIVTDASGYNCTVIDSFAIVEEPALSVSIPFDTLYACQPNNLVTATALGGVGSYTYSWSNGDGTSSTMLGAGKHFVTIFDSLGCTASDTVVVILPSQFLSATIDSIAPRCFGTSGTITAQGVAGYGSYTYTWTTGENTKSVTKPAGTYCVEVTDLRGCKATACRVIQELAPLSVAINGQTVLCPGQTTVLSTQITGGSAPYAYLYSTGQTSSTITVGKGTYTVRVTDASSCVAYDTIVVQEEPPLSVNIPADTVYGCQASSLITATALGGVGTYIYVWSNGDGDPSVSLGAGKHYVTIVDSLGCTASDTVVVALPSQFLDVKIDSIGPVCNGGTGTIVASGSGGYGSYSYKWASGEVTKSVTKTAGTYCVVVTDFRGCTDSICRGIVQQSPIEVEIDGPVNICKGTTTTLTTVVTGGKAPYTYSWNNGQTTQSITNVGPGTYSVIVTDANANGCMGGIGTAIKEASRLTNSISFSPALCFGSNTGKATAFPAGSIAPYTYSWTPNGASTKSINNLAAGTYYLEIKDSIGCSLRDSVKISQPAQLFVNITSKGDVNCSGGKNGFAEVLVTGGSPEYLFNWLPYGGKTEIADSLTAGVYTVNVTDQSGCIISRNVTIAQPAPLQTTFTRKNITCFEGNDGEIDLNVTGGTAPYNYIWTPNVSGTDLADELTAGAYSVTISDAHNCVIDTGTVLTQNIEMMLSSSSLPTYCGLNLGQGFVQVLSGGYSPFSYQWDSNTGSQTTNPATNLGQGFYSVVVEDKNGCEKAAGITVINNPGLIVSVASATPVTCFNGSDGKATISVSGNGVAPFQYEWFNKITGVSIPQNSATVTGLKPGTYYVRIKDANGCESVSADIVINNSAPFDVVINRTNITCFGACDGIAASVPSGGTAPYQFKWNDPSIQTTQIAYSFCPGTYQVVVTDDNGCQDSATTIITEPPVLNLDSSVVNTECAQSNGNGCVLISGGVSPYTVLWPEGQTDQCVENLAAGTYIVKVTDKKNCTQLIPITVASSNAPVPELRSIVHPKCFGDCDASATVGLKGDSSFFNVQWDANAGSQTSVSASGLCPGIYAVTFTTDFGCVSSLAVTIDQPKEIKILLNKKDPSCNNYCDGSARANVTGGTGDYTIQWINDEGTIVGFTDSLSNLCSGTYRILVFDENDCSEEISFDLSNPLPLLAGNDPKNLSCNSLCDGSIEAIPINGVGPFTYKWDNAANNQLSRTAFGLCVGTYTCEISDANNCKVSTTATLQQPDTLISYPEASGNVTCNGKCDGFAQLRVVGGVAPYSYEWTNGLGNGVLATDLCAGKLTGKVIDANGCQSFTLFTITEPTPINIQTTAGKAKCSGECDGTLLAQVNGGVQPYTLVWDAPGAPTTNFVDSLCPDFYTVYVQDANGCSANKQAVVVNPPVLGLNVSTTASSCGQDNGSVCLIPFGGQSPYTYLWSDPKQQTTSCADSLRSGCYDVLVTDANQCSVQRLICVNDQTGPVASVISSRDLRCFNSNDGYVEFNISGGTGIVKNNILNQNNQVIDSNTVYADSLVSGCYTFTVTDALGCKGSVTQCIKEPQQLTSFVLSKTDVSCFQNCDGKAEIKVVGGTKPYQYNWNGGSNPDSTFNTGLCPGNAVVLVSDSNGCQSITSVMIIEPQKFRIDSVDLNDPSCFQFCDGSVEVFAAGGSIPYKYTWSTTTVNGPVANAQCKGPVSVNIVDQKGCATSAAYVLNEPLPLALVLDSVNASCSACNGKAVAMVSGGTAPYNYDWSGAGSAPDSSATASLCAGQYIIQVADANGCTIMGQTTVVGTSKPVIDSLQITDPRCKDFTNGSIKVFATGGVGDLSFQWDAAAFNQTSQLAVSLKSGSYCVTVTDESQCAVSRCGSLTNPEGINVLISPSRETCKGEPVQVYGGAISGNSGTFEYHWNDPAMTGPGPFTVNPVQNTTFCFFVTDEKGCISPDTCVSFTVIPDPKVIVNGASEICQGDSVTLTARAFGGKNTVYTWDWKNRVNKPEISTNNFDQSELHIGPDSTGFYYVNVKDGCNQPALDSVFVIVNEKPDLDVVNSNRRGCAPFSVELQFPNSNGNFYQIDYNCDGEFDFYGPDSIVQYTYPDSGIYTVCITATTEQGCVASRSMANLFTVYPTPVANFEITPGVVKILEPTVQIEDHSVGADIMTWEMGSELSLSGQPDSVFVLDKPVKGNMRSFSYDFKNEGIQNIVLTVSNRYGCSSIYSVPITVEPDFELFVPNAFTPDGDGLNEFFTPKGVGFKNEDFKLDIYDRWGEIIFHSDNYLNQWDGKIDGRVVQNDVYIWVIDLVDFNGRKRNFKGHVTVFK